MYIYLLLYCPISLTSLRYDEPTLWKAVVARLAGVPILTLEEHLKKRSKVTYGQERNAFSSLSAHASTIANSVDSLRVLDRAVQNSYLDFTLNYS